MNKECGGILNVANKPKLKNIYDSIHELMCVSEEKIRNRISILYIECIFNKKQNYIV